MEALRQYLLSVTAAAIVCGIAEKLLAKKGTAAAIGRMMTGIFLALVVISPLGTVSIDGLEDFSTDIRAQANEAVSAGQAQTHSALAAIIKERTQAYILEKAEAYQVLLDVSVEMSQEQIPVPLSVRLEGSISPYAKARLQDILEKDLGIPKEKQVWT